MTQAKKTDPRKYSNFLIFSVSLIPLVLFLFIVWKRTGLPFVFEWGESAGVNQINRILAGWDLYGPPSIDFTPLVYTPLYYYLAAGLSALIGSSLFAARIISVASAIGSAVLIGRLVKIETRNGLASWISGMIYLACFSLSDGFYDLVRVDSLYVLFVLIAFSVILNAKNRTGYIVFGAMLIAGFFVKQSFLLVFFPIQGYLIFRKFKLSWTTLVVEIFGLISLIFLFNSISNSWFSYYIFELPREHGFSILSAVNFWIGDTIRPLGIAIIFNLIFLLKDKLDLDGITPGKADNQANSTKLIPEELRDKRWMYFLFIAGAAGTAWITRSSNGGGANNSMVIYAALAIGFGIGAGLLFNSKRIEDNYWVYAFFALIIALQFIGLIYNPFNFLPTADEVRANENIGELVRNAETEVLIPYRSHLSEEMRQTFQIHMVNLFELTGYFKGNTLPEGFEIVDQIRYEICSQSYGLIIIDQPIPWFENQMNEAYIGETETENEDFQESYLLSWQQGNNRSYIPRNDYDLEDCLDSIWTDK